MEIWNEVCLIFLGYHIFCFTDWVPDPTWRYRIGFSCVLWTLVGLVSNMLVIMVETFWSVKMKIRQFWHARKLRKLYGAGMLQTIKKNRIVKIEVEAASSVSEGSASFKG